MPKLFIADFGLRIENRIDLSCFCLIRNPQSIGGRVSDSKKIVLGVLAWMVVVSGLHLGLNINWSVILNDRLPEAVRRLNVAYIPVT